MTITTDDLGRITQETDVVSSDGQGLGRVHQVYTSDASGDPAWVTVDTGRFGSQESFVPLSDATFDGQNIRVAVGQEAVHGAPRVDAGGHLSVEEEDDLYRYYQIPNPDHSQDDVAAAATGTALTEDRERSDAGPATGPGSATGDEGSVDIPGTGQRAEDYVAAAEAHPAQDRDEVADRTPDVDETASTAPRRARGSDEDRTGDGPPGDRGPGDENVRPGERTTRLRRYVVTERVVQTVEELPDDEPR